MRHHLLLLLRMLLNQSLCLLLVFLLDLLRPRVVGLCLRQLLVIFFLLRRQLLTFLILLFVQLVLLRLILLVRRRISSVGRGANRRRNILHVRRPNVVVFCVGILGAFRSLVGRSGFAGCYHSVALELVCPLRRSNWRPALIRA